MGKQDLDANFVRKDFKVEITRKDPPAKELDFEKAAEYRDRLILVKGELGQKLSPKNNRRK